MVRGEVGKHGAGIGEAGGVMAPDFAELEFWRKVREVPCDGKAKGGFPACRNGGGDVYRVVCGIDLGALRDECGDGYRAIIGGGIGAIWDAEAVEQAGDGFFVNGLGEAQGIAF